MDNKELLDVQLNVEETDRADSKGSEDFYYEAIEGTPFAVVKKNENYILVGQKYMMSKEEFAEPEDAKKWVGDTNWELVMNLIHEMVEFMNEKK